MSRKYKFFIKDKSVIFTDKSSGKSTLKMIESEWIQAFKSMDIVGNSVVYCPDLEKWMDTLRSHFDFVKAGGGFVLNEQGQVLVIHRRGFWDLPKGKQEEGESIKKCAKREVEEETGIGNLSIESQSFITYHLYSEKKRPAIKESHWYKMSTSSSKSPVAQTEEDIVEAKWTTLPIKKSILKGAYASIRDVIEHYSGSS